MNTISGIFKEDVRDAGMLINPARRQEIAFVPASLIREYALVEGAAIAGTLDAAGKTLSSITTICGQKPEAFRQRPLFESLVAITPCARFDFGASPLVSLRLLDLLAPLGKGARGMIVAPPKAGKTTLMEQLAQGIRALSPTARILVLLVDERPEEVTYFRRTAQAEVYASSSDQSPAEHVALAELMLAHIRTELECGNDVVVLMDSLTRLVRAVNRRGSDYAGRTLSGGLDAGALTLPRKFFGLARAIENGGSVTLVATVLVDTNSRMDQVIYEEFKSTGNYEVVLRRDLAEAHLFPALDLHASGARQEQRLYAHEDAQRIAKLRRALAERSPRSALKQLLALLEQYPNNEEFLKVIAL
ncbi:MAG: transcription termination factor Rho [Anaerolineae bacterium]|nr:transcription termination factor Rho [Anaerolineae bacterium]